MAPMAVALILGWWLVTASRAQQVPRPSLSLHPSQGVSLGDTVTLRCHLPRLAAWVWLYQEGGRTHNKYKDKELDAVEFSFMTTSWEHAGMYRCQYHVSDPLGTSEKSDPVELMLTDARYPPPSISFSFEGHMMTTINISIHVGRGSNVTIQCWNWDYGSAFLLHKGGHSAPIQRQDPSGGGMATFTLFGVTPADTGTYSCSYHPSGYPFVSSPLGDSVTLEVTSPPTHPGANGESRGSLVVAVAGGCATALAFILVLIIFFLLPACRGRIQRTTSPGEPLKSSIANELQVPPADNEGLTCTELQAVTPASAALGPAWSPSPRLSMLSWALGNPTDVPPTGCCICGVH
ncbi:LOW QUALITY PROTEIN: T-cell-interacting, activating receptor on myeloid cells protein 1-like [Gallus gallus]|uniref:LOW QUALITY PROTEIN: T-cell-interacting, activating receptor on myeloid cells protein 1-like n=1 Tax=Gallus gallus TaxID=9031 RepID=UPI001EFFB0E4|nr:LOW QUALITY PROTEIN: T-cell-interacting, activating receptor on myeloid cells protein 1-like [Gallus gallus]